MAFAAAARAPFFIHWADFKPCTCCSCQESMYHTGMFVLVVKCVSCEAPHHRINTMFPHLRKKCQSPQVNKPISRTKWNSHHQSRSKPLTWPFGSSNLALSPKQLNVKEPCDLWPRKHSLCFMQWKHMKTTTTSNAARQDLLDWDAEFGLRFVKAYMGWTQTQDVFNSGSKRSKDMRNLKSCGILSDSNLPTFTKSWSERLVCEPDDKAWTSPHVNSESYVPPWILLLQTNWLKDVASASACTAVP